jgi:hypothetical protein
MTPQQLREWAKGTYTTEAGTELLLRAFGGRFAQPGRPWVNTEDPESPWIDFDAIPDNIGGFSGGEKRFLLIAASLGGGTPVALSDALPGLDRTVMELVLAAVAHAAGTHQQSDVIEAPGGSMSFQKLDSLYPWPKSAPAFQIIDGGKP